MPSTVVVFSSDEKYFPLTKGLVLSILKSDFDSSIFELAFQDLGCNDNQIEWLRAHGVRIFTPSFEIMGTLSSDALGYRRGQLCRPFLPRIFPEKETFIWLDCDTWVQDPKYLKALRDIANSNRGKIIICPECHYTYDFVHANSGLRRNELYSYFAPLFGEAVAAEMSGKIMFNSGVFAMTRESPTWTEWAELLRALGLDQYDVERETNYGAAAHMADQTSLNIVLYNSGNYVSLDPSFNYICIKTNPTRHADGTVKMALPPHNSIGLVHLAGGMKYFGAEYLRNGLLFDSGAYLDQAERDLLLN